METKELIERIVGMECVCSDSYLRQGRFKKQEKWWSYTVREAEPDQRNADKIWLRGTTCHGNEWCEVMDRQFLERLLQEREIKEEETHTTIYSVRKHEDKVDTED